MWQIYWMISLIPVGVLNWIINLMLIAGVSGLFAGWLGKFIPFYGTYAKMLKPIGIVLLCAGLFFKGGYVNELAWRAKVADLEEKVKISEEKSKEANVEIKTKIVERVKVVKQVEVVIQDRIIKEKELIDKECKVAPEAINILNDAAKNPLNFGTVTVTGEKIK
jgi:hypothetical protein